MFKQSIESRLAVCSWSLQPTSPDDLFSRMNSIGIPRVQLALSPLLTHQSQWGGAIERLHEHGYGVVSGMMQTAGEDYTTLESIQRTGGLRPDETWPENRDHAVAVAELAAAGGITLVTFHAGFLPADRHCPEYRRLLDRLRIVAGIFDEHGIVLGLETGQESAETLIHTLDALGMPNVCVNFDPANMILYGVGDPIDALQLLAPRVCQLHIKDAVPSREPGTWGTEVPVGTGAVDWAAFMQIAHTIDPPVNFVIEREAGNQRAQDIRAARDYLVECD